tara:strand:+ start:4038 stop:4322 length:285 start_codon:yes stop_codon:yes gene_type:complete
LTATEDLLGWHRALFPDGYSGLYRIKAGSIPDDGQGPMQVVSSGYGREQIHFVAPSADTLSDELDKFLSWLTRHQMSPLWQDRLHQRETIVSSI